LAGVTFRKWSAKAAWPPWWLWLVTIADFGLIWLVLRNRRHRASQLMTTPSPVAQPCRAVDNSPANDSLQPSLIARPASAQRGYGSTKKFTAKKPNALHGGVCECTCRALQSERATSKERELGTKRSLARASGSRTAAPHVAPDPHGS